MIPINNLDVVQSRTIEDILDNLHENHWVKGFAGTGKTVVLTHVLERLAALKPTPKVCFATYTHALKDLVESGLSATAARRIDVATFTSLRRLRGSYDVIVADEMQDIPTRLLSTISRLSGVLIMAADLDQSIYRSACDPSELANAVEPAEEHELREIHRINENIFHIATCVHPDVTIAEGVTVREDDSLAQIYKGSSHRDEVLTVFTEAVRVAAKENPSAILLPSKALLDKFISVVSLAESYSGIAPSVRSQEPREPGDEADPFKLINAYLKKNDSPLQVFGGGSGSLYDSDSRRMVYLMTYHSAKGLDFANVFLPNLTADVSLEPMKGASDIEERRLFFVAATRARERLYLTYHDEPHRFINDISTDLLRPLTKQKRAY